ncbi:MAG: hypothetical protein ACM3YO_07310 [Bacteroidota bacterium]
MKQKSGWLAALAALCITLPGCVVVGINSTRLVPVTAQPDRLRFFIQGKEISSLSEDRRTITLALVAEDPDGGALAVNWTQDKDFGTFNSTSGKSVQWTASRDGDYTMILTATVRGSRITDDPDVAHFLIPVVGGKIQATELAPEVTVAPQSVALFRLPTNPAIPEDSLTASQVQRQAQLVATTYKWDPQSNTKVKQTADFEEIKWIAADTNLLSVDDNGLVKLAPGATSGASLVMATSKTNSVSKAACMVTVRNLDTKVEIKSYNDNQIDLVQRTPVDINAWVSFSNPLMGSLVYTDKSEQGLDWSSSDLAIAQVDENGRVTLPASSHAGTVTITARSHYDPSKLATMSIAVQ